MMNASLPHHTSPLGDDMHLFRLPLSLSLRSTIALIAVAFTATFYPTSSKAQENNQPPAGFTALFNGKDFDDWTGGTTKDPRQIAVLQGDERTAWDEKMKKGIHQHWHVDN